MASSKKILPLLVVATALSVSLSQAKLRKFDCGAVSMTGPLPQYKDICWAVNEGKIDTLSELENRLDVIEMCTCNLLRHDIVWQSMLTHEVETLFYVIKEVVSIKDSSNSEEVERFRSIGPNKMNPDENTFFWDRLNILLRNTDVTTKGRELGGMIITLFGQNFYSPETGEQPLIGQYSAIDLQQTVSGSCRQLLENMTPFLKWFNELRKGSRNNRFVYRIVSYDDALYQVMTVVKVCQYMLKAKTIA